MALASRGAHSPFTQIDPVLTAPWKQTLRHTHSGWAEHGTERVGNLPSCRVSRWERWDLTPAGWPRPPENAAGESASFPVLWPPVPASLSPPNRAASGGYAPSSSQRLCITSFCPFLSDLFWDGLREGEAGGWEAPPPSPAPVGGEAAPGSARPVPALGEARSASWLSGLTAARAGLARSPGWHGWPGDRGGRGCAEGHHIHHCQPLSQALPSCGGTGPRCQCAW